MRPKTFFGAKCDCISPFLYLVGFQIRFVGNWQYERGQNLINYFIIVSFRCLMPHSINFIIGSSKPLAESVKLYWIKTGIEFWTLRLTIPIISKSFNSLDNIRGVMLGINFWISVNLKWSCRMQPMIIIFHLPEKSPKISSIAKPCSGSQFLASIKVFKSLYMACCNLKVAIL